MSDKDAKMILAYGADREIAGGSAAEYIENIQRKLSGCTSVGEAYVARIMAARMLAGSERGSRRKLVRTPLTVQEIEERATLLEKDPTFRGFCDRGGLVPDDALGGHGGRLDDKFTEYIRSLPEGSDINRELLSRYIERDYVSFDDFIDRNTGRKLKDGEDQVFLAAKLCAAAVLRNTGQPFSLAGVGAGADMVMQDSVFLLVVRNKNVLGFATGGRMDTFNKVTMKLYENVSTCRAKENLRMKKIGAAIAKLTYAQETPAVQKKMMAGRSAQYKSMVKAAKAIVDAYERGGTRPADYANAINCVLDYQTGREEISSSAAKNERYVNSMGLLWALTSGSAVEYYLDDRLQKTNDIRGLKSWDAGYMGKEIFIR